MRNITIKTVCAGNSLPRVSIAPQNTLLGCNEDCSIQIHKIENIPDDISNTEVCRQFALTTDVTWLGKGPKGGRHIFDFAELGIGKIIR